MPRKGYSRVVEVPADILDRLNRGDEETLTLAEGLAIDFPTLLQNVAPKADASTVDRGAGITGRLAQSARTIAAAYSDAAFDTFAAHRSDTVRGWAAFVLGQANGVSLAERFRRIRPLANDPHFGVREWAWLALRPHVVAEPGTAIRELLPWTLDASPFARRFAIEITRPRGVWCAHIESLKKDPEPARHLLERVQADPEKYVQDSAANWLNDASKTRPDWVTAVCAEWCRSTDAATGRICQRALRSLRKK